MGSLQRADLIHATALINPLDGFINNTGFASFTRTGVGQYTLACDERIAAAEGEVWAQPQLEGLSIFARGRLRNANDGVLDVECRSVLGALVDPAVLVVEVRQIATGPATALPTGVVPGATLQTIYVNSDTGNDANPGTALLPKLTINGAIAMAVPGIDNEIVLQSAVNPYPVDDTTFQPRPWLSNAQGATCIYIRGDVYTETLAPFAAGIGTTASLVVGAGLVVDAHYRQFIQPLTGAAVGQLQMVRNNTVTDIVPCESFSVAPGVGDSVRLVRPACEIDCSALTQLHSVQTDGVLSTGRYQGGIVLESCTFINGGAPINFYGRVNFYACDDDGSVIWLPGDAGATAFAGIDNLLFGQADAPARVRGLSIEAFKGAGYASYNATGIGFCFSGYSIAAAAGCFEQQSAFVRGGRFGLGAAAGLAALAAFSGGLIDVGAGNIPTYIEHPTGTVSAVRVSNGQLIITNAFVRALGVGGSGFISEVGGVLRVGPGITGNSTEYGAHARFGGQVYLQQATLGATGTTANLAAGVTPDVAANLGSVGLALLCAAQNDGSAVIRTN